MHRHHSPVGKAERTPHEWGRDALTPQEIPRPGLKQVFTRVWRRLGTNDFGLIAAGVAFYILLALFPGIATLIALYGLLADPTQVGQQFSALGSILPAEAYRLIDTQLRELASRPGEVLGFGFAASILLSVWSATKGTKALISALNIAYQEQERRSLLGLNLLAFGMTFFLVILAMVVIALIVAVPVVLGLVGLGTVAEGLTRWLRWPVLALVVLFTLAVVYRYGPDRRQARWRWVSWGSVITLVLWLIASGLFSFYVSEFDSYNATYGSVGAVIVLLMWLFISAFTTVLGAVVNAEMERQTARDTTYHGEQPLGRRGAYVADHLPEDD